MSYRGTVDGGIVKLDRPGALPDGTIVEVQPISKSVTHRKKSPNLTLSQKLLRLAGTAKGLPRDLALNHDHYLHGLPKK